MVKPIEPRDLLRRAFEAAVRAADPGQILADRMPDPPKGRVVVVGAGKAAASMARAVEDAYRGGPAWSRVQGLVVTRYGHGEPTERIEVAEAAHPVPDAAGVVATQRILELVAGAGEDDLVIILISGGGSALLSAPRGIDLEQKRTLTERLLASGATIQEMNVVRKHLSDVKGGRLALAAQPAQVRAYVISDVVGDDLAAIASGPTVPDPSTFGEALAILDRYDIEAPGARAHLKRGADGDVPETPKPGTGALSHVRTDLVASNQQSLEAAAAVLEAAGYPAHVLASGITGEARSVGQVHAAIAAQVLERGQPVAAPCALLSGGETTVTVRGGGGRGGRNSEFALGFALALPESVADTDRVHALAADTDGIDGSEDNAGAFVGPTLFRSWSRREARAALDRHDSYGVFAGAGMLLETGPTRTNVNDLRIVLVDGGETST